LTVIQTLKLALILSTYRQHDFALTLLRRTPLSQLPPADRRALKTLFVPQPSLARRLAARALRGVGSDRRRALADALHHGVATVWEDAHHF
jgi:hypothetical protein